MTPFIYYLAEGPEKHLFKAQYSSDHTELDKLADHPDREIVSSATLNPNMHPNTLHRVAMQNSDKYIAGNLVDHPSTCSASLHHLAKHPSQYVRLGVAKHKNTSLETLAHLVSDHDGSVNHTALTSITKRHPALPINNDDN